MGTRANRGLPRNDLAAHAHRTGGASIGATKLSNLFDVAVIMVVVVVVVVHALSGADRTNAIARFTLPRTSQTSSSTRSSYMILIARTGN